MVGILNINTSKSTWEYDVAAPRDTGRGSALNSTGIKKSVSWNNGYVVVNGEQLFSLAAAPILLDLSFDQLDRPVVAYRTANAAFIWFYNSATTSYQNLNIGNVTDVAVCNDFPLNGNNIACAYAANNSIHYRLQSDQFAVDYTLAPMSLKNITMLGVGTKTRSLNVVGPYVKPTIPVVDPYPIPNQVAKPVWWNDCLLAMAFDGEAGSRTFIDYSPYRRKFAGASGAKIIRSDKKFGSGCLQSGTYDDLGTSAGSPNGFTLTGDFTIQAWVKIPAFTSASGFSLGCIGNETSGRWETSVNYTSGGALNAAANVYGSGLRPVVGISLTPEVWGHICWVRVGYTVTVYANGVAQGSYPQSGTLGNSNFYVQPYSNNSQFLIDDLTIIKRAIYTANFTPPTQSQVYTGIDGWFTRAVFASGFNATPSVNTIPNNTSKKSIVKCVAADQSFIALTTDGEALIFGDVMYGLDTIPSAAKSGCVGIAITQSFSAAVITSSGGVVAWGNNTFGQTTVPVAAQSGVVSIVGGATFFIALKSSGAVITWGQYAVAIPEAASANVTAIDGGTSASIALKSDGSVVCWGENTYGQLNRPESTNTGCSAVASGFFTSAAVKNGGVILWGHFGIADTIGMMSVPEAAQSGVIAVSCGNDHHVALKADGSVVAWGHGEGGRCTLSTLGKDVVYAQAARHWTIVVKSDNSVGIFGSDLNLVPSYMKESIRLTSAIACSSSDPIYGTGVGNFSGVGLNEHAVLDFNANSALGGDCTIEFMFKRKGVPPHGGTTVAYHTVFAKPVDSAGGERGIGITDSDGSVSILQGPAFDGQTMDTGPTNLTDGNWHHVAVCVGPITRIFADNELIFSKKRLSSGSAFGGSQGWVGGPSVIAADYSGYSSGINAHVDNLIISAGNHYDGSFIPPVTYPIGSGDPYWGQTTLLLQFAGSHNSDTFTDDSGYGVSVSAMGNAKIQSIGGENSLVIDGSGDGLLVSAGDTFNFGTGPFTIEVEALWNVFPGDGDTSHTLIDTRGSMGWEPFTIGVANISGIIYLSGLFGADSSYAFKALPHISMAVGQRYHIAYVRNYGKMTVFLDGVPLPWIEGTESNVVAANLSTTTSTHIGIAQDVSSGDTSGKIYKLRVTKAARYSAIIPFPEGELYTQSKTELVKISSGNSVSLALTAQGGVMAWGSNTHGQQTVPTEALSNVVDISAGSLHCIALKSSGKVIAWGFDDAGQCNVPASALSGVIAIDSGGKANLAIKSDGSVIGWGSNYDGQLNIPSTASSVVTQVSMGGSHAIALKSNGSVIGWGSNDYGQITIPSSALNGVVKIANAYRHAAALKSNGSVIAWGDNSHGQLTIPTDALSGVTAIAAGNFNIFALKGGGVIGWGSNDYGQLNIPSEALSDVINIDSIGDTVMAIKTDGSLVVWGRNDQWQTSAPFGLKWR